MSKKVEAGSEMPKFSLPRAGGGAVEVGQPGNWQVVVVYRGKHCPICRNYLKTLNGLREQFKSTGAGVVAISGDPKEKAESEVADENWQFPVGYGLTVDQMRVLGLYISEPRSSQETDRPFPEPGLFVINPEGRIHVVDISNAPFARPDLVGVLKGLQFIQEKQYPIRGTMP
ncbi:MAG: peroxiredoxin-like family protein [Afipia sp.]